MAGASGYYNDKQKLADALALARSFSRAKPAKGRPANERFAPQRFAPHSAPPPPTRQLRSATRQQFAQSFVRPGALDTATASHRQAAKRHQRLNSASVNQFAPRTRPTGAWQAQKELPSITGGRGLDFLSRNDAPKIAQQVAQSVANTRVEPPSASFVPIQQEPRIGGDASADAPKSSVLDTFFALMSQHEKEMEQVDPLVDKMKQWKLQSPTMAKAKIVPVPAQAPPSLALFGTNMTLIPGAKVKIDQGSESGERNKENMPDLFASSVNGTQLEIQKSDNVVVKLPTAAKSIMFPTPPRVTGQLVEEFKQFKFPDLGNVPVRLPSVSKLYENTRAPIKTSPLAVEVFQTPLSVMNTPKPPTPGVEVFKTPPPVIETHRTPLLVKCTCTPAVKPQRGLSSSRFASKESPTSPFENNFSVSLQVTIHKDFCPLYSKQSNQENGHSRDARRSQQKLRAEAEPFTSQIKPLIPGPGF